MLGIQPSFREENHSGSEHSILLPYYQQPVDANTSEQEQEQQKQQQQKYYNSNSVINHQAIASANI